jgi:transposase-like protein
MPNGIPNKRYTGEFKQMVVETIRNEKMSYREAERQFGLPDKRAADWERIYLEEGSEGLYIERRGRPKASQGGGPKPNFDKKLEEDLIAENQRLRAEVAYLKKLNALVLEEERKSRKRK